MLLIEKGQTVRLSSKVSSLFAYRFLNAISIIKLELLPLFTELLLGIRGALPFSTPRDRTQYSRAGSLFRRKQQSARPCLRIINTNRQGVQSSSCELPASLIRYPLLILAELICLGCLQLARYGSPELPLDVVPHQWVEILQLPGNVLLGRLAI